ncbi:MAG: Bax inhibitor-1/YccA family protein [bacterium]|nr:Bax inhibitor-1/YccA family protein [bacterium]
MANPVLSRAFEGSNAQAPTTPAGYPAHPGYQPQGQQQAGQWGQQAPGQQQYGQQPYGQTQYGQQAPSQAGFGQPGAQQMPPAGYRAGYDTNASLEHAYNMPPASGPEMGRMTVDDVVVKTGLTLGVVTVTAVVAWFFASANPGLIVPLWIGGLIGGLVLGLVNAFRKEPSVPLIMAYAVFEGAFIGAISLWANTIVPGVVPQAVFATFVVAAVCLFLYRSGIVKVTEKFKSVLKLALISYLIFCVVNLFVMLLAPQVGLFGIRSVEFGGIAIGLGIGLIAVVIASMSLIADFDAITKGVAAGVPARFAWTAAFGITVTLIWLYIEILRILLILFSNR